MRNIERGFTLVELMVAVAIIGVLLLIISGAVVLAVVLLV